MEDRHPWYRRRLAGGPDLLAKLAVLLAFAVAVLILDTGRPWLDLVLSFLLALLLAVGLFFLQATVEKKLREWWGQRKG